MSIALYVKTHVNFRQSEKFNKTVSVTKLRNSDTFPEFILKKDRLAIVILLRYSTSYIKHLNIINIISRLQILYNGCYIHYRNIDFQCLIQRHCVTYID